MVIRSKAAKRRDYFEKNKRSYGGKHATVAQLGLVAPKVTYGMVATLCGSGYLHRKTARALPMTSCGMVGRI